MRASEDARIFFSINIFVSGIILWMLLIITYVIYQPGIASGFLFDDFINLDDLGKVGEIDNWNAIFQYILLADAGPTGRPLSVLSYLINDNSWPSIAISFKYTNVMLHMLCGVMLAWLFYLSVSALRIQKNEATLIAILAASIWLFNPYHVSTVLYPVQRMTILAALFVISGLGFYVKGRLLLSSNKKNVVAYIHIFIALVICTPLAVLSKENGALLPLLVLLLEGTVLANLKVPYWQYKNLKIIRFLFLWLPLVLIASYFVIKWETRIVESYIFSRNFNLTERLLTESRVLFDYLFNLLIPKIQTSGLYHDNYVISKGILTPPQTLFSIVGVFLLLIIGWVSRKSFPIFSIAVLFFFGAHVLESTFIPLELYFEHRNYLPSIFLSLGLVFGVYKIFSLASVNHSFSSRGSIIVIVCLIFIYAGCTYARTSLWSDLERLGLVWAEENPGSARAQQQAAFTWQKLGLQEKAKNSIDLGIQHNEQNLMLHLQLLLLHCNGAVISNSKRSRILSVAENKILDQYAGEVLETILNKKRLDSCPNVEYSYLDKIITRAKNKINQSNYPDRKQHVYYIAGQSFLYQDKHKEAKQAFIRSYKAMPNSIEAGLQISAILASNKQYEHALDVIKLINKYKLNNSLISKIRGLDNEVERMKKQIIKDMK